MAIFINGRYLYSSRNTETIQSEILEELEVVRTKPKSVESARQLKALEEDLKTVRNSKIALTD